MSEPLTDPLDQRETDAGGVAITDLEPAAEVEAGADAVAGAAPSPDLTALQATIDEQNRKLEELSSRLTETQRWGHHQSSAAAQSQALVDAMARRDEALRQQQEYYTAMAPPTFSDEERQAVLEDPAVLERKMREMVNYGYKYAYHTMAPALNQAVAAAQVTARLAQRERSRSEKEARAAAEEAGITVEEFDAFIPEVRNAFDAMPDQYAAESLRMDPTMVLNAMNVLRTQRGGVPIKKQKAPPSLGPGSHQTGTPAPINLKSLRADPTIQRLKDELGGMELSDDDLRKFAERRAAAARGRR